ncbi:MAG: outer membrane beta-barrel protein [Sulfurimonas sp.]|nr:outer membrane beta-barrel protein [Sulfurimonas sp.]
MKKILFLAIFVSSLFGEAKIYVGANYGAYNESFTSGTDVSAPTNTAKAKIGYGIRESYAIELTIEYIKNKKNIFSDAGGNDSNKLGLNIEFIKAFDFDIYINPFLKAGFGAGRLSVEKQTSDISRLSYGSFNLGTGVFIPLNEYVDIEIGYEYKYVSYENFDAATSSQNRGPVFKSNVNIGYIGFNVRF